jgi:pyridoxal phosphate enzyme (YggS family)
METRIDPLAGRLAVVRRRIALAADRSGRDPEAVKLVVVTKSAPPSIFVRAAAVGIRDVGENRVQAAEARQGDHRQRFTWHMVGHLQRNKARRAVELFDVLHGIDSLALLQRVESIAGELDRSPRVLLQVNVAGESAKHGADPRDLPELLAAASALRHARLVGLMTMAPLVERPEQARAVFASLARLRDDHGGTALLPELSMGMTDDFEVAVEEGATMVRIGRALLEDLDGEEGPSA